MSVGKIIRNKEALNAPVFFTSTRTSLAPTLQDRVIKRQAASVKELVLKDRLTLWNRLLLYFNIQDTFEHQ